MQERLRVSKNTHRQSDATPTSSQFSPRHLMPMPEQSQSHVLDRKMSGFGYEFANIPIFRPDNTQSAPVQTKLTIGEPGDKYEQEADRMAEQVMQMDVPNQHQSSELQGEAEGEQQSQTNPVVDLARRGFLQRQALVSPQQKAEGQARYEQPRLFGHNFGRISVLRPQTQIDVPQAELQRKYAACEEEEQAVQMKSSPQQTVVDESQQASSDIENQLSQSKGGGSSLSEEVRSFMEPRFGADFSQVRAHTDNSAVQMSKDLNAQAFTHGSDIYFGAGKYDTESNAGKRLLAHELTHVVQQKGKEQAQAISLQVQRQEEGTDNQTPSSSVATLDGEYHQAMYNNDWQVAAEYLNGFNQEDIQSRLAQLTPDQVGQIHQGALDNPRVGPNSQVAQLTASVTSSSSTASPTDTQTPPSDSTPATTGTQAPPASALVPTGTTGQHSPDDNTLSTRDRQLACVVRLGGCSSGTYARDAGIANEYIPEYNKECKEKETTNYDGSDIYPSPDECNNPPKEPLSTGEKLLLSAFVFVGVGVAIAAIIVTGEVVIPIAITAIGEASSAAYAFYLLNAIAVNDIGLFATGLLLSCEGDVLSLLKAIGEDPLLAAKLLAEIYILHVKIRVSNEPTRRVSVPTKLLPQDEQTDPQNIRFKTVGPPNLE